ncbi:MerR family transcriptional regulator [Ralstonia pseudosolanacearum]|uniref:MerR family transcriptional regulator n=1 Tax=Ralstonia pseudosolanacearum TaxID=1310165 RepID=UPI003AACF203
MAASSTTTIEFFTAEQSARLAGLSLDMVNYLCRHEIVVARGNTVRGRGQARRYLYADVLMLRVMAQLLKQGVSVLGLRKSLAAYRKRKGSLDVDSCRYFVTDGYNVFLQDGGRFEDLASGQRVFAFVLDMEVVRNAVQKEIRRACLTANG